MRWSGKRREVTAALPANRWRRSTEAVPDGTGRPTGSWSSAQAQPGLTLVPQRCTATGIERGRRSPAPRVAPSRECRVIRYRLPPSWRRPLHGRFFLLFFLPRSFLPLHSLVGCGDALVLPLNCGPGRGVAGRPVSRHHAVGRVAYGDAAGGGGAVDGAGTLLHHVGELVGQGALADGGVRGEAVAAEDDVVADRVGLGLDAAG